METAIGALAWAAFLYIALGLLVSAVVIFFAIRFFRRASRSINASSRSSGLSGGFFDDIEDFGDD